MRVLVIEDDMIIGQALVKGFSEAGFQCDWVLDGEAGAAAVRTEQPDVIVLDQMLPKLDGLDLLREMRREGNLTPVVLLTAIGSSAARVNGLNCGADDYLPKPFDFFELMARVNAVVRRSTVRPTPQLTVSDLTLDLSTRRVVRDGRDVGVTPIEFSLLELLMRYAGQLVTRQMLCERVWGFNWDGTTNVIEVHVNRIRGKIDAGRSESIIKTVRGRGYSVAAEAAPTRNIAG